MNELEAEKQRLLQQQERGRRDIGMNSNASKLMEKIFFIRTYL